MLQTMLMLTAVNPTRPDIGIILYLFYLTGTMYKQNINPTKGRRFVVSDFHLDTNVT